MILHLQKYLTLFGKTYDVNMATSPVTRRGGSTLWCLEEKTNPRYLFQILRPPWQEPLFVILEAEGLRAIMPFRGHSWLWGGEYTWVCGSGHFLCHLAAHWHSAIQPRRIKPLSTQPSKSIFSTCVDRTKDRDLPARMKTEPIPFEDIAKTAKILCFIFSQHTLQFLSPMTGWNPCNMFAVEIWDLIQWSDSFLLIKLYLSNVSQNICFCLLRSRHGAELSLNILYNFVWKQPTRSRLGQLCR